MYNMLEIRNMLDSVPEVAPIQRSEGLMRRVRLQIEEEPEYDPRQAILDRIKKFQGDAEEMSTTSALEEVSPGPGSVENPIRPVSRPLPVGGGISGDVGGRSAAEAYLGRSMDDKEWEMLLRATHAEATGDARERAGVMSVILNRVKSDNYPNTITDVLMQQNQFQAVTGTKNDPNPSSRFRGVNSGVISQFRDEVAPLLSEFADKNWLNFTAGNPDAYGPGTDISFLDKVKNAQGSMQIGGTIFGTVR
jgi:hypothetical protein